MITSSKKEQAGQYDATIENDGAKKSSLGRIHGTDKNLEEY